MQLSEQTLEILNNFSKFNSNILLKPGNKISTIMSNAAVMAYATIDESIPIEFGILDLPKFLATLSFFDKPELDFQEDHNRVVIKSGNKKFNYYATDKINLSYRDQEIKLNVSPIVQLTLSKAIYAELIKVSSTLGLPHINITSDGTKVHAIVCNAEAEKNASEGNRYSIELGDGDGSVYNFIFATENMKFLSADYDLSILSPAANRFIAIFKHKEIDLMYYTALMTLSSYTPTE